MQKLKQEEPKKRVFICTCCGQRTKELEHLLSKGLVRTLVKVKKKVLTKNKNKIHPILDLDLKNFEYNNFQKLRYFGFIAHYRDANQKKERGYWLLTRLGNRFLLGLTDSPLRIRTINNTIAGKSKHRTTFSQVLENQDIPYWDDYKSEDGSRTKVEYPNIKEYKSQDGDVDAKGQKVIKF